MPPLRPCLALVALLAVGATSCSEQPAADPSTKLAAVDQPLPRDGVSVRPTTTTTAPPTTTTPAAPAPPPTVMAARRSAPAPAPAPPPPPAPAPNISDEGRALQLVNGERARAGLAPLQVSGGAQSVARAWSVHMAGSQLAHNPDLSGDLQRAGVTGWTTCGENVGYGSSVDGVHALFMGSSGHRANILSRELSQVGIGVVHSGGKVWVTLDFVG